MSYNLSWILFLMLQCAFVILHPVHNQQGAVIDNNSKQSSVGDTILKQEGVSQSQNEQVISVRITSSVAIGRTKEKSQKNLKNNNDSLTETSHDSTSTPTTESLEIIKYNKNRMTDNPLDLSGANIEFIKQLNAKKEAKEHNSEPLHPFELLIKNQRYNTNDENLEDTDSLLDENDDVENIENIPLARKVPSSVYANHISDKRISNEELNLNKSYSLKNEEQEVKHRPSNNTLLDSRNEKILLHVDDISEKTIQNITQFPEDKQTNDQSSFEDVYQDNNSNQTYDSAAESSMKSEIEVTTKIIEDEDTPQGKETAVSHQNYVQEFRTTPDITPRLTTVSFNIVHDNVKLPAGYNEQTTFTNPTQPMAQPLPNYQQPKIYSEPARIYSEPAKFYSEPAKIYSEPAKVYSEPAKVYSEPAKIYSEPAKFYSEPASLHLNDGSPPNFTPWQHYSSPPAAGTTTQNTTPVTMITKPSVSGDTKKTAEHQPEKNYEVDEKLSILSNGRSHGVQETSTEKCKQDNCKVGYVVEGKQYKKYRVEERTSDGFIVGEYGVVRNEDGALRGVRYTADSDASPRLIYDALMKFLQLR